jgi:hypothetical protein
LELGGEVIGEGVDFSTPTVKYVFAWRALEMQTMCLTWLIIFLKPTSF